jgi:hypothetical protein
MNDEEPPVESITPVVTPPAKKKKKKAKKKSKLGSRLIKAAREGRAIARGDKRRHK